MSTRRTVLAFLGAGAAGLVSASSRKAAAANSEAGICTVRPRHIEGPYFVDEGLNRSDIRSDPRSGVIKYGVPLRLAFRVSLVSGRMCLPLTGARVDVWHCDADGLYSDTKDWQESTIGQKFLRGYQITDRQGHVSFTTIFPGWYPNRAVHIHFKIRTDFDGRHAWHGGEFTSQIYFDDELTDRIHAEPAYVHRGARKVRNDKDLIYLFRGNQLLLPLREEKKGYGGTFDIAIEI